MNTIEALLLILGISYVIGFVLGRWNNHWEKKQHKFLPRTDPNRQIEAYPGILNVEEVHRIPAGNFIRGIKGTLLDLEEHVSYRTGKPFYTGKISDTTDTIRVMFFRNDVKSLEGRKIVIKSSLEDRAIRRDCQAPQIIVFRSAYIATIDGHPKRHYLKKRRSRKNGRFHPIKPKLN